MYQRVLLAYDGSHEGRNALREGALVARRNDAEVFLLCVCSAPAGVVIADSAYPGPVANHEDNLRRLFDEAMERLRLSGFKHSGKMAPGEPVNVIAKTAKAIGADLVVVGHRHRGPIERWWSGSTGASLIDHIDCSLLIACNKVADAEFFATIEPGGDS